MLTFTDAEKIRIMPQLILPPHNTIYLDIGFIRRDEIWFTGKKDDVTELYSLDDIVI